MSTHTHDHPTATMAGLNARMLSEQPTGALLSALGTVSAALCLRTAGSIRAAWYRHTVRNELRELDARTLNDLGLTKDDVHAEARKWFWQG